AMRGLETVADLNRDAQALAHLELLLAAELFAEGHALEQLHDDESRAVGLLDEIGDVDDVLVPDSRNRLGFGEEARHGIALGGELGPQDLQRDAAAELDVLGEVDLAHAALAQHREHAIGAERLAEQVLIAGVDDARCGRMRDRASETLRGSAASTLVAGLHRA